MSLALGLGLVVAKAVATAWSGSEAGTVVGEVADLFRPRLTDLYAQRRAARQFDDLADVLAKNLEPYIDAELRDTDSSEVRAAVLAAQRAIGHGSTANVIVANGLESAALAAHLISLDKEGHAADGLSASGENLYLLLIDQAAAYIVSLSTKLPDFQLESTRALLSTTSRILEIAEEVVKTMPRSGPSEDQSSGEVERFRQQYLNNVYERANQLRLFGVDAVSPRHSYELSVAYIPLQVQTEEQTDVDTDDEGGSLASALGKSQRMLISGDAGSGKTTLLQWLTVNASRSAFDEDLSHLNGRIPFLIRLRSFAESALPRPDEFVQHTAPFISGEAPKGWVERTLASGQGLVMVDGFDELGDQKRAASIEWIDELVAVYPETIIIVTSRDAAVEKSWTLSDEYRRARLMPMSWANIREFIDHWHGAARANADEEELDEINLAARRLIADIRDRASLKALCTSPLLCALLCAMNLLTGARLPSNRMGVYRSALQMLLERRDSARRIHNAASVSLSYDVSFTMLSEFAKWMQDNEAADAEIADLRRSIERTLPRMQASRISVDEAVEFLLERSGVIRQPSVGRVDFVHRTFLEYLAAWAFVQENSMTRLVGLASDDYWREVIVMAAGHAPEAMRESLISGLLIRGDERESERHASYLVAVSCMETAGTLPVELREAIADRLTQIMPPQNMTDAAALAAAGNLAVPLLRPAGQGAVESMACVRALSLIGGSEAFEALVLWGSDKRVTVARQLIRAWQNFDPEDYAREVLSQSYLDRSFVRITDVEQLDFVTLLPHAQHVVVALRGRSTDVSDLPVVDTVRGVYLSNVSGLDTLKPLSAFRHVKDLMVEDSPLRDVSGLEHLDELEDLTLRNLFTADDLSALSEASPTLQWLRVQSTSASSVPFLRGFHHVALGGPSIRRFAGMEDVKNLNLSNLSPDADLSWIGSIAGITRLTVQDGSQLSKPGFPDLPDSLESFSVLFGSPGSLPGGASSVTSLLAPLAWFDDKNRSWIEQRPINSLQLVNGRVDDVGGFLDWAFKETPLNSLRFQVKDARSIQPALESRWELVSTFGSTVRLHRRDETSQ